MLNKVRLAGWRTEDFPNSSKVSTKIFVVHLKCPTLACPLGHTWEDKYSRPGKHCTETFFAARTSVRWCWWSPWRRPRRAVTPSWCPVWSVWRRISPSSPSLTAPGRSPGCWPGTRVTTPCRTFQYFISKLRALYFAFFVMDEFPRFRERWRNFILRPFFNWKTGV